MEIGYDEAHDFYQEMNPGSPFFETWIPREKYLTSFVTEDGSLTVIRSDGESRYAMAVGADPFIPEDVKKFSIEREASEKYLDGALESGGWDCYFKATPKTGQLLERKFIDSDIDTFLKEHAPQSSVFPGNPEIEHWIEVTDGEVLIGVAALCRWESGHIVISSVATHSQMRGRGIGKEIMNLSLQGGRALGEETLSLGVFHLNEAGIRLYESTGFTLMHHFMYIERR